MVHSRRVRIEGSLPFGKMPQVRRPTMSISCEVRRVAEAVGEFMQRAQCQRASMKKPAPAKVRAGNQAAGAAVACMGVMAKNAAPSSVLFKSR